DHAAALAQAESGLALWGGAQPWGAQLRGARRDGAGRDAASAGGARAGGPVSAVRAGRAAASRALVRGRGVARAGLGRHAEAVEVLTGVAGERPQDEEVLAELLRAEEATVGPAAALARYEAYRRELRDRLGADPGEALQAVYRRLLQAAAPA